MEARNTRCDGVVLGDRFPPGEIRRGDFRELAGNRVHRAVGVEDQLVDREERNTLRIVEAVAGERNPDPFLGVFRDDVGRFTEPDRAASETVFVVRRRTEGDAGRDDGLGRRSCFRIGTELADEPGHLGVAPTTVMVIGAHNLAVSRHQLVPFPVF